MRRVPLQQGGERLQEASRMAMETLKKPKFTETTIYYHSYIAKIAGLAVRMNFPMRHLTSPSTRMVLSLITSPYALKNKSTVAGVAPIDLNASMGFSTS